MTAFIYAEGLAIFCVVIAIGAAILEYNETAGSYADRLARWLFDAR